MDIIAGFEPAVGGSNPSESTIARQAGNQGVARSNRAGRARKKQQNAVFFLLPRLFIK